MYGIKTSCALVIALILAGSHSKAEEVNNANQDKESLPVALTVGSLYKSRQRYFPVGTVIKGRISDIQYKRASILTDTPPDISLFQLTWGDSGGKSVSIGAEDGLRANSLHLGQVVYVVLRSGWYTFRSIAYGNLSSEQYRVLGIDSSIKTPIFRTSLTVDQYFEDGLLYRHKPVVLSGVVTGSIVEDNWGSVVFDLSSKDGRDFVRCYYDTSELQNDRAQLQMLRAIKPQNRISVRGKFSVETESTMFDIDRIISNEL